MVYDYITFSNKIPNNSQVVELSKIMLQEKSVCNKRSYFNFKDNRNGIPNYFTFKAYECLHNNKIVINFDYQKLNCFFDQIPHESLVLQHMDFSISNVLTSSDDDIYIVDWESLSYSLPSYDFITWSVENKVGLSQTMKYLSVLLIDITTPLRLYFTLLTLIIYFNSYLSTNQFNEEAHDIIIELKEVLDEIYTYAKKKQV